MRLLSWTRLCIWSSALCISCLAGPPGHFNSHQAIQLLGRQKNPEDNDQDRSTTRPEPKQSATSSARKSESSKPSATAKSTSATTTKTGSTKTTSASPRRESTTRSSSSSSSLASLTSTSSSLISISASTSSSISTSASTSSTPSTDLAQPTSILAPQPQSASSINTGGIVAGVVLGAAVVIGMAWIAIAKWRENKKRRTQPIDEETKRGFAGEAADGQYSSSHDSLLLGGKLARASNALRLKSLSPLSRAHSFVPSFQDRPGSQIPQDVLPPLSPVHDKGLPQVPQSGHEFARPLGSHPHIAEMPSPPHGAMPTAGLQAGRPLQRKPLPQINPTYGQGILRAHQPSPPAELPG